MYFELWNWQYPLEQFHRYRVSEILQVKVVDPFGGLTVTWMVTLPNSVKSSRYYLQTSSNFPSGKDRWQVDRMESSFISTREDTNKVSNGWVHMVLRHFRESHNIYVSVLWLFVEIEPLNFLSIIPFNALHALKNQLFVCLFVCLL